MHHVVAALLQSPVERGQLQRTLRAPVFVRCCDTVAELKAVVTGGHVMAMLTEMYDRAGACVASVVGELCRKFPSMPVALYTRLTPTEIRDAVDLARNTSVTVAIRGHDDLRQTTQALIRRSAGVEVAEGVTAVITRHIPCVLMAVRDTVAFCARETWRPVGVQELVAFARVDPRTLVRRFRAAGLSPPSRVIGWCRIAHAARLLGDPARTLEEIADELRFPAADALHHMLRRYTGLTASEIRDRGGLDCVLALFERHLSPANTTYDFSKEIGYTSQLGVPRCS